MSQPHQPGGSEPLHVESGRFAAWARARSVALPYPIDISAVAAAGLAPADAGHRELAALERVCSAGRASVFVLTLDPEATSETAVAVAADRGAVMIVVGPERVSVRVVRATELVASIVATLPRRAPLPITTATLAEERWNALVRLVATGDSERLTRSSLGSAGIPMPLAEAMVAAASRPVRIGMLGASAWTDGVARLGPSMASWFEYEGGAVLASLTKPRHGQGRTVTLEPYDTHAAGRVLVEALGTAQREASRT